MGTALLSSFKDLWSSGRSACLGMVGPGAPSKQSAESRALMNHQLFPCSWHPQQKRREENHEKGD